MKELIISYTKEDVEGLIKTNFNDMSNAAFLRGNMKDVLEGIKGDQELVDRMSEEVVDSIRRYLKDNQPGR